MASNSNQSFKKLGKEELIDAVRQMRALNIISIYAAKSGHPGGTLSIMDITAVLFLNEANFDPKNPKWEDRDRIIFSAGHKAPAIYSTLCQIGMYADEDIVTLRKFCSPFQGHPFSHKLPGIEISTGSLGQGLGAAVGSALAARLDKKDYRVYCIMGDGEQQEGSIWEAVMAAGHFKLDNICGIVDKNNLQIDGKVEDVMNIDPLTDKYRSFNWHVIEIDGHDIDQILEAFKKARQMKGKPTVIIADTVKGKGVSFMENVAGWHGIAPTNEEEFEKAIRDIGCKYFGCDKIDQLLESSSQFHQEKFKKLKEGLPQFSTNYWWNENETMHVEMEPTRFGFGNCLNDIGDDERIVTLHADISGSIKITDFEKDHPERLERVFSVGIAEQNMMSVAAGLAVEGKIPITGTYGVFASGRPWDQIRTTICYDNLNVKIGGAHGGISVGADGATHQALEEISLMAVLPNMHVVVPCDSVETKRLSQMAIQDVTGPAYIRFAREATPVVTNEQTPLVFGKANVIRFRQESNQFIKAFETMTAESYKNENEALTFITCGPMVAEAMRAAYILKKENNIETRIVNMHTVKPIDKEAIIRAMNETGVIITCEEHQVGGFGNMVAGVLNKSRAYDTPLLFDMIGVEDRFGESGGPWELMIHFKLTAEHIAEKAKNLINKK